MTMNLSNLFATVLVTTGTLFVRASGISLPTPTSKIVGDHTYITDTIIPVKPDPVFISPASLPDLSILKKNNSLADLKYVALGGKLSAGYRDGGLYRAGQLTAYPNLIACQMGLTSFQAPLFDTDHGNGTGYLVLTKDNGFPNWKKVHNNTGFIDNEHLKLLKYTGKEVDNLSFPEGPVFVSSMPENYAVIYPAQRNYISHYNRLLSEKEEGSQNLFDILGARNPDICTYETHFDEFLGLAEYPVNLSTSFLFGELDENVADQYLIDLKKKGTKLVLFTIPQVMDLPYFHIFSVKELAKNGNSIFTRYKNNHMNPILAGETTLLLPTESVRQSVLGKSSKGISIDNPFNDEDVISEDEVRDLAYGIPAYNNFYVLRPAKKYDIPVVDLESIYKTILNKEYTTDDGLVINGSFPDGNFFSSDARTPSALGQAIIANETIKVINKHYKTSIPLINITEFRNSLKN